MSWDSYVDTLKSYSAAEAVTEAVIVGKDGCQPWTTLTKNLNLSEEEKKTITQLVTKKINPGSITVGGEKYMILRTVEDDDASLQIFARKKEVGSICFTTTTQTTIITFTEEEKVSSAGEANEASKKIATYLTGLGF